MKCQFLCFHKWDLTYRTQVICEGEEWILKRSTTRRRTERRCGRVCCPSKNRVRWVTPKIIKDAQKKKEKTSGEEDRSRELHKKNTIIHFWCDPVQWTHISIYTRRGWTVDSLHGDLSDPCLDFYAQPPKPYIDPWLAPVNNGPSTHYSTCTH